MIIKASAGTHVGDSLPEIDCIGNAAAAEILCRRHVFSLVALEGNLYLASGRLVAELGAAERDFHIYGMFVGLYYSETIFRPMMEAVRVVIKKRRQKVAGSWKMKMPTSTEPRAPMPVHTG